MNNMTTEEKAKAYDKALKVLHKYDGANIMFSQSLKEEMFPELRKESEDERIRKRLIDYFYGFLDGFEDTYKVGGCVKWEGLDVKDVITWLEKQKTSDKALQYLKENHSPSEVSDFQAAMNIAVAKAYDKGYNDGLKNQGEQKPAWSEEDESYLKVAIENCYECGNNYISQWLKSLKDRIQPKPKWKPSDEQMGILWDAIVYVEGCNSNFKGSGSVLENLYSDLIKLKGE